MMVFLVPAGRRRYELYSETPDELVAAPDRHDGALRRWSHRAAVEWHRIVEHARRRKGVGRLARWRDAIVCRLAESIAEQRTLWALRTETSAVLRHPSDMDQQVARSILDETLAHARTHHQRWFVVDLLLFVASVVFFFIPGPNLVAYYFAFRFIGHLQSWRGARQAMERTRWAFAPDPGLAELCSLVDWPRDARAPRVAAIAARLNLPRLTAFFDRVAVPSV
jgi:hypothetical protein